MTRRAIALLALTVLAAGACTSRLGQSSTSSVKMADIYAAGPSTADARSLLGAGTWWTSAPTFAIRPLNAAAASSTVVYQVIQRYANIGTAETWRVVFTQFSSATTATTVMTNIQNNAGNGVSGQSVGDKSLYYGQQLTPVSGSSQNGAPFETLTVIRVGSVVIESTWDRKDGFPPIGQLGKVASTLASRVKDAQSGKIRSTPISANDLTALPPPNQSITLLGTTKLPVEAVPLMLNLPAPTQVQTLFTGLGVTDFVYGDYALDDDTHMEVQAAAFTFASTADANSIFDGFRGNVVPDANGLAFYYNGTTGPGQYDVVFVSGKRVGLMVCRSTAEDSNESASRACETPIQVVSAVWRVTLNG